MNCSEVKSKNKQEISLKDKLIITNTILSIALIVVSLIESLFSMYNDNIKNDEKIEIYSSSIVIFVVKE